MGHDAYHIVGWDKRYEVNASGDERKADQVKLRKTPLRYVRSSAYGFERSEGMARLQEAAGPELTGFAFGLFIKLLEVAGRFEAGKRGWVLDRNCEVMEPKRIARKLGWDDKLVDEALMVLQEVQWIEVDYCKFAVAVPPVKPRRVVRLEIDAGDSANSGEVRPAPGAAGDSANSGRQPGALITETETKPQREHQPESASAGARERGEAEAQAAVQGSQEGGEADAGGDGLGEDQAAARSDGQIGGSNLAGPAVSEDRDSEIGGRGSGKPFRESGIGDRDSGSDAGASEIRGGKAPLAQADATDGAPPGTEGRGDEKPGGSEVRAPPLWGQGEGPSVAAMQMQAWDRMCELWPTLELEETEGDRANRTTVRNGIDQVVGQLGETGFEVLLAMSEEKAAAKNLKNPLAAWTAEVKRMLLGTYQPRRGARPRQRRRRA